MQEDEINWPVALRSQHLTEQTAAIEALRRKLFIGLKSVLSSRGDIDEMHLEDFVQEGLLRILNRLDQFQGRSKFTTWAHSITVNTAFSRLRRKRWQDVSLDALMEAGDHWTQSVEMPAQVSGAGDEQRRLIDVLRKAIDSELTAKQRAAILGELREMPFDQISEMLGTNRNAAYKMLHDARRALKKRLTEAGVTLSEIQNAYNQ